MRYYALSNILEDPFWLTTVPMAIVGWVVALVGSILSNSNDPGRFPVFSWWGVAFEMICILLTLHVALTNRMRQYRLVLLSFLTVATIYTTNSTNNFVWRNSSSSGAASAGYILLSIINFVWIMYFGTTSDEPVHRYVDSFATEKKPVRPSPYDSRMRSHRERTNRNLPPSMQYNRSGTMSQPYRRSEVPQNLSVEGGMGYGTQADHNSQDMVNSDPLSSTYLYSRDQLQHHGLSGYEVQPSIRDTVRTSAHAGSLSSEFRDEDSRDLRDDDLPLTPVARAVARHSYYGNRNEGEFSFNQADLLDVFDMDGNWWYCKAANGDEGICPSNYLELLPLDGHQNSETTHTLPNPAQNGGDSHLLDTF